MNHTLLRGRSFLYLALLWFLTASILLAALGSATRTSWAQGATPVPLQLTLSVAPNPAQDVDGATVNVLVEADGAPVEGVKVLLRSDENEEHAGFEDGDPSTSLLSSIVIVTDAYGRATASWGLDVCLLERISLTITAEAHVDGYVDASASETIAVLPHVEINWPPYGTETLYYDVGTHKTFVSVGPSEGSIEVGDTLHLEVQVGREINYTDLDLWNLPVIKGRGAVLLSIPKVDGVAVAHVVESGITTEVYHPMLSDEWLPISHVEDLNELVSSVEWLVRIHAIAHQNWIALGLGEVPGVGSFLSSLVFHVGQGPQDPEFDSNNENVELASMAWHLHKFGVDSVRMTVPIQFDIEGDHEIAWFTNWQYSTSNQYVTNDAGAQSQVAFHVTPASAASVKPTARLLAQPTPLVLRPGERSSIHFDVQNSGEMAWAGDQGFRLDHIDGETLGAPSAYALENEVPPGHVARWEIPIVAPGEIGGHIVAWQMTQDGEPFGPVMSCLVLVFDVPEGEIQFDPLALLEEWLNELREQAAAELEAWWQDLQRQFVEGLQRELERWGGELEESLLRQCCGANVIAPLALLLGVWGVKRKRR